LIGLKYGKLDCKLIQGEGGGGLLSPQVHHFTDKKLAGESTIIIPSLSALQ